MQKDSHSINFQSNFIILIRPTRFYDIQRIRRGFLNIFRRSEGEAWKGFISENPPVPS